MSDNAKRRLSIDLDEIERQLRQTGGDPRTSVPGQPPAQKADPLAELARIVGQDDPFGALLDEDAARRRAPQQATQARPPVPGRRPEAEDPRAAYAAQGFSVDERDAWSRGEDGHAGAQRDPRDAYAQDDHAQDDYAYDEAYDDRTEWDEPYSADGQAHDDAADWAGGAYGDEAYEDEPPRRRGLGRKSLVTAGALITVAFVGVGTALWFAGSVDQAPGEPPLIAADPEPVRVAPENPGGVEIPNQDTALLDAQDNGETRIVDREEQPVDIAGLAREPAEAPRVVLPAPGAETQAPAAATDDPIAQALGEDGLAGLDAGLDGGLQPPLVSSPAVAALGEPRRVRTVTVRPDGTIIQPTGLSPAAQPATAPAETASAAPAQAPGTPAPLEPLAPLAPVPEIGAGNDLPSMDLPATDLPATELAAVAPEAPAPVPPPAPARDSFPAPAPAQPSGPLQLSALPTVSAPVAQPAAPTGGYAVQLAIRGSEDRARAAFSELQAQYSSIIGDGQPIIRQAVVNGSTIYRVRVGPYSLERANQACDQIKAAAGDCFVASNQ
ncbi:SPOR domain-containing protein [Salinarimonas ramus]|uniref:SPOR domain-containing protein n=1 Tax=Salinarimonas ramus TaxID=690164 RepID=A0A917QHT3_9HYPH|nr:SPOR domain-containing protein [Salinarimonas ramus]GGK49735.1 hypothetical protein GCM10011322_40930 [Salinarimonas ramus]